MRVDKPHPCHSEERSDVGIRILLIGNLLENTRFMRFGYGLPRQCAHWLAMTGFFDSLSSSSGLAGGGALFIQNTP
mgnify:CR=1 FL=1